MSDTRDASAEDARQLQILVVDDEEDLLITLEELLRDEGHEVATAQDGLAALGRLETGRDFDLVIADIRMPRVDGLTLFDEMRREHPDTDVILITGEGTISEAVRAMKQQAVDYLPKPFSTDRLLRAVRDVAANRTARQQLVDAEDRLPEPGQSTTIIGESPAIRRLREQIAKVAKSEVSVVITGESGTGKELVARRIHELSSRAKKPFIAVNCAAFPADLLEAELFGHERGAFTGANRRRPGRFRMANGGILFLDEVVELSVGAQATLLRVLQDGRFEPLGSTKTVEVDVRVLSACNVDLRETVRRGEFREDLFYRLKVLQLEVAPLRERRGDIPLLVAWFLEKHGGAHAAPREFSHEAWEALIEYDYPGNVRELEHAVRHALVLGVGSDRIELEHLPKEIRERADKSDHLPPLSVALGAFERDYLRKALAKTRGSKTQAAELLDVSRKTLYLKLKRHGLG